MRNRNLQVLIFVGIVIAGICSILGSGGGGGGGTDYVPVPTATANASATCMVCHARNVAPVYVVNGVPLASAPTIVSEYKFSKHYTNDAASCASCHKPNTNHPNPVDPVVRNPDATANTKGGAGNICLECHSGLGLPHFANNPPVGPTWDTSLPAQYVDDALTTYTVKGCRSCHNPHDTTSRMPIFQQYATSGHGDVRGPAWVDDPWKNTSQAACQRCHTASGFIDQITPGSNLKANFTNTDNTRQTLYCIGCHNDYSYTVRAAGAVTNTYSNGGQFNFAGDQNPLIDPVTGLQTAINTFPNVGKSNLCLNCHSARAIGDSIKKKAAAPDPFTNLSFINSHYLTGGATVYGVSGYEYTAGGTPRNYVNRSSFEHNQIGTTLQPATGTGGPCVGCHMNPANHTFKGWTKDNTDRIASVTSTVCATCHSDMTPATMNEQKDLLDATVAALKAQLEVKMGIIFDRNTYPYFYTKDPAGVCANIQTKNWLYGVTPTFAPGTCAVTYAGGTAGSGPDVMGAAFNLNLFTHDGGAYTHNRYYVKRLMYDSIDYLIDGNPPAVPASPDVRVTAAINALATAGKITADQATKAISYVLRNGARP